MNGKLKLGALVVFILILILIFALFGCEATTGSVDKETDDTLYVKLAKPPEGSGIFRIIDYDAKVACWIFESRGGIYCLPLEQTGLKER